MTMMTEPLKEASTAPEKWIYLNKGSEEYLSKIGLFKTLFKLSEDPLVIATLIGGRSTQVKVKYEGAPWQVVSEHVGA